MMKTCPFCNLDREPVLSNEMAIAFFDRYPVSKGHLLVVPIHHVADYFDLEPSGKSALWSLVDQCQEYLREKFNPDGFNVGFNVNQPAGQTVYHVHIHVIPRYKGDMADPTGGVRGVIPEKRVY